MPELLHSNTDESVYEQKEKILVRKTGNVLIASLDNEQFYTDQSIYNLYLKPNKKFDNRICLAILNSRLLNYYYNKKLITNADVFPYIKGIHLKKFPFPIITDEDAKVIIDLVDTIVSLKKRDYSANEYIDKINHLSFASSTC